MSISHTASVRVQIEVEKHSNQKREYDSSKGEYTLDRVLPYPYFFPYAYGFFPNTMGNDGDELDALVLTDRIYRVDDKIDCRIVGGLVMEDEHGMDEKIFVVPINDKFYLELEQSKKDEIHNDIIWFFSNYKSKCADRGKWSRVDRLMTEDEATDVYDAAKTRRKEVSQEYWDWT